MYNPQLETFLRVADAGSFNKAATPIFCVMSSCAVPKKQEMKQRKFAWQRRKSQPVPHAIIAGIMAGIVFIKTIWQRFCRK